MKIPQNTQAVTEILGTVLILALAVTCVSIIYLQVLGSLNPVDTNNVTIIGKIEEGTPIFEFQRGESLGPETNISITLAGLITNYFSPLDNIINNLEDNQVWNIGERIVLESCSFNDKNIHVEATIVDTKTNSIIFWGILQQGLISKFRGGIWHLNESSWNSIPNEVLDSSGNNNHGIAKGGAQTTTSGISENAGFFDGFNDLVKVNTAWTLDLEDSITIEAWMKPQEPQFIADVIGISGSFGYYPFISPVFKNDGIYALVSEDKQKKCKLSTVIIDSEGFVTDIDNMTIGESTATNLLQPKLIHMNNELILVSYIDKEYDMHLKTFNISRLGSIEYTGYELDFTDYNCDNPDFPSMQKITDNICAIAYWVKNGTKNSGIIKTVEISPNGNIVCIQTRTYESWYDPSMVYVDGNIYAIAYRNSSDEGILKMFTITSDGNISYTGEMFIFENISCFEPNLLRISKNLLAVAYRDYRSNQHYGIVTTLNVLSNGSITWTGKMLEFETEKKCYSPCLTTGGNDTYVIAYATAQPGADSAEGYVITIRIEEDGSIYKSSLRKLFDDDAASFPTIIYVSDQTYAISYTGHQAHPGTLITMLIGPHGRGIYKGSSYEIFANLTIVEGYINNVYVIYPFTFDDNWYHIALTYNGNNISLYINGTNVANTSYPNHRIWVSKQSLYIGRFYCGYLDEISIYHEALTQEQIQNHYLNPGIFEYNVYSSFET
jgi:hypothetical protein